MKVYLIILFVIFLLSLFTYYFYCKYSRSKHIGQEIRLEGPKSHYVKNKTPVMGGIIFVLFFIIGSLIGANHMGFWELNFNATAPRIFLPDVFGWGGALVIQLLIIFLLYIAADLFEKKKMGTTDEE